MIATPLSGTQISLTWSGATDNVGITRYTVFRDGKKVTFLGGGVTSFTDTGLAPATTYTYAIKASDKSVNAITLAPSYATATAVVRSHQRVAPYKSGHRLGKAISASDHARIQLHRLGSTQRFIVWRVSTIQ